MNRGLIDEMQAGRRGPRLLANAYRRGNEVVVHVGSWRRGLCSRASGTFSLGSRENIF
jgi:hypothetical protein